MWEKFRIFKGGWVGAENLSGNSWCYNVLQIPVYIGYRSVTNKNNSVFPWIFAFYFVYLLCNMIDMINKWFTNYKKKYKTELDAIGSFLFIALLFYLTYFALWVFCPC